MTPEPVRSLVYAQRPFGALAIGVAAPKIFEELCGTNSPRRSNAGIPNRVACGDGDNGDRLLGPYDYE
jgi:hypothetical protein